MDGPRDVTFYLDDGLRQNAEARAHNFFRLLTEVLEEAGFAVFFHENSGVARLMSERLPGYAIFHMDEPTHPRALTVRRVYHYPFWAIERHAARWEWDVARAEFPGATVPRGRLRTFYDFWGKRLFGEAVSEVRDDGFLYIPLQGLIRQHRSFQSMSPVDMIRETARRYPDRDIRITLHPNEDYTTADRKTLDALLDGLPNCALVETPMKDLLAGCHGVVTQNSGVAFAGFFFGKPAVLFAEVDFHHIAGSVPRDGLDAAFTALDAQPDFAAYLWWFLQDMAINAGRPEAKEVIAERLREHGWPV